MRPAPRTEVQVIPTCSTRATSSSNVTPGSLLCADNAHAADVVSATGRAD
jgi:hypothetical protein